MKLYKVGFIVGKFMPLHAGHEFLINTAIEQCEKVFVLSYHDKDLGYDHLLRATWLETLFPTVSVQVLNPDHLPKLQSDVDHQRFCASFIAMWCMENGINKTHTNAVFSSEEYGEPFSKVVEEYLSAPVDNVVVDLARLHKYVSGTALRSGDSSMELWTQPFVRNQRILIVGGESSGKTTLVNALTGTGSVDYSVMEYGRKWWREGNQSLTDLMHIAEAQVMYENERALDCHMKPVTIFCDTGPLTTAFYAQELFGVIPDRLKKLMMRGYSHYFLLKRHFKFHQDGTRRDVEFSDKGFEFYKNFFDTKGIKYTVLDKGTANDKAGFIKYVTA
jgi:NadR type nicotinamide-nucleotide adenylyltransferase